MNGGLIRYCKGHKMGLNDDLVNIINFIIAGKVCFTKYLTHIIQKGFVLLVNCKGARVRALYSLYGFYVVRNQGLSLEMSHFSKDLFNPPFQHLNIEIFGLRKVFWKW